MSAPYRVLLTRADNSALLAVLQSAPVAVVCVPLVAVCPTGAPLPRPAPGDWVVFTSVHGVRWGQGMAVPGVRLAAVGPKTAAALAAAVRPPDVVPVQAHGEALARALGAQIAGCRVWLPRAALVPDALDVALERLGARPCGVAVYRTLCPAGVREALIAAAPWDAVALASGSAARHYVASGGRVTGVDVAAIGPSTAAACQALGLPVAAVAAPHTAEGLAEALLALSRRRGG